ncbi:hypothetical protein B0H13DRAFT_2531580 [Mycena leptocephala]|nr:hypothetical protein B0H13DRAFT_2531580 [Mycena leptocephala]
MAPSVIVIGASGAVGRPLMAEFLAQKSNFGRIAARGIEIVVGSFLEAKSYAGFDVVISLAGNAALKLQPGMVEAAIAGGARHFISSEYFRERSLHATICARAKDTSGFRYTLILSGAVAEYTVSEFNGVDVEKHVARTYCYPEARLHVTAIHECVRVLTTPYCGQVHRGGGGASIRQPQRADARFACLGRLPDVEGVHGAPGGGAGRKVRDKYLDPALAAEKQEVARAAGDSEGELLWSACATMANGYALLPEPSDHRFALKPETAKETLNRMFGKK